MPAGSRTDPQLPKAEPISNSGSASVITYLRRGKKLWWNSSSWERGVRNSPADTKVTEEGGGGGAPGAGADITLQPLEETMVERMERCKKTGAAERNCCIQTVIPPPPYATH